MPTAASIPTMIMTMIISIKVKPCSFSGIIFLKVAKNLVGDFGVEIILLLIYIFSLFRAAVEFERIAISHQFTPPQIFVKGGLSRGYKLVT